MKLQILLPRTHFSPLQYSRRYRHRTGLASQAKALLPCECFWFVCFLESPPFGGNEPAVGAYAMRIPWTALDKGNEECDGL